jgi:hypothetical protein
MNTNNFFSLFGVLLLFYGILYLFATDFTYSLYDMSEVRTSHSVILVKNLGQFCIGAGLMSLFARNAGPSIGRRAVLIFFSTTFLLLFFHSVMGAFYSSLTSMGFVDLVVQGGAGLGAAYFLFKERM